MHAFDGKLIWWHWNENVVPQKTIQELGAFIRLVCPNTSGIAVKTSNGHRWQGTLGDPYADMAITGPESIQRWVETLHQYGLETHLWCVLHGKDGVGEAQRVIEACQVPGVSSMILDIEAGDAYFGSHPPETAREIIQRIRAGINPGFHLGLCCFIDDLKPDKIHLREWLPHVQSLHPMVYHWDFSNGASPPEPFLDEAFTMLRPYQLPIIPILGVYPETKTGTFPPPEHLYQGGVHALEQGAAGISIFRLGNEDVLQPESFKAINQIPFKRS